MSHCVIYDDVKVKKIFSTDQFNSSPGNYIPGAITHKEKSLQPYITFQVYRDKGKV